MENPILTVLLMLFGNPFGIAILIILIVLLVKTIIRAFKKKPAEDEQLEEAPKAVNYDGPAKIFINGGAPAYGDVMGKITVDGKSMELLYSEAPIEITFKAGKRNVVIEGGLVGDARIDRVIDFAAYDVLTVDMPGDGDRDLIRHQMIGYYEYSKALSDCGYHVTRKQL